MNVALQIRDVPETVRDAIAQRAEERGQSMQAYLLDLVSRDARIARNLALLDSTAGRRVTLPADLLPEEIVREGRDHRANGETDE
ncbi:FitA-like ribbon-helix-helix domain-containing protein [Mumia qirimensis]|uniref:FitA-like ribbon-helix-helix domain-containing protein n=1 Tax=Mumia qirimensis TaxID=3234852 RepID=UPI00351D714C